MIRKVIQQVSHKITALPFVQRYGGVVQTVTKLDVIDEGLVIENRFPVSCSTTALQCWEQGKYKNLIPDDSYKSIFYFEERDAFRLVSRREMKGQGIEYSARVRLVGWLNLAKLGSQDCELSDIIAFNCIGALTGSYTITTPVQGIVQIRPVGMVPKGLEIFERYTYNEREVGFLLYPYDYFAVDFDVIMSMNPGCLDTFTPTTEIDCIDLTL